MSLSGKNVLLLAYKFPPLKSVGSQRLWKWYRSWEQISRKTVVFTTSNRNHLLTDGPFPDDEVPIEEIPTMDYRRILTALPSGKGSYFSTSVKQNLIVLALSNSLDVFPWNILWGEGGAWYIWNAYRKAVRRIKQEGIEIILSSHRPFSDHIIGWLLKRRFPHLIWIADFRDIRWKQTRPLNACPDGSNAIERRLLQRADVVTTVSAGLKNFLEQWHSNVQVLYNGVESMKGASSSPKRQFFTISYTGSIYPELQDASLLFHALQELISGGQIDRKQLQFITSGPDDVYWRELSYRYGLTDVLVHRGLVSRAQALEQQERSHINVLLSWNYPTLKGILTSKLFEYLRVQHPVMALINGETDPEFEGIFERTNCGEVFYSSDDKALDEIKESLLYYYNRWKHSDHWSFDMSVDSYSWEVQFKEFLSRTGNHLEAKLSRKKTT